MSIVFYYAPMTSATRVHWALEELGVPYEIVKLDLRTGEQKKPDYLQINPNGKVPAMVDDGTPIFESLAILLHLGTKYGVARKLWPAVDTVQHAQALAWSVWGTVTLGGSLFRFFYNLSERVPAEQRNAAQAEAAKQEFEAHLQILEGHLKGREHMMGPEFSLVDISIASAVSFASRIGVSLSAHPIVEKWVDRCTKRPAALMAVAG